MFNVELQDKTSVPYEPVYSDAKARFLKEYRFDISKLEPLVAKPHSPDNRALARECKDVKIDRVYIGSCTGGKKGRILWLQPEFFLASMLTSDIVYIFCNADFN
ncbi:3-isopropylmalate dehydratase large subunit, chloroplastic-like [Pyrus x bretschneideri]|uniref:3-isopropylmalate dehydratase large subunit, chloroplastic-like n=1 Tax=Pyrus x bretschneideri TaxID=225117 RepID=UPI002030020C|nr:3-isopropylmalate dehydratase large subunit, chloroplastic-like [Pyrus x bretschneideri]